ncbi:hypothetical protein GZ77_14395 [Endozoicomonas montiporae]|uniref:PTS system glucose-specific EIICB component n=2 Tax=Endozoicomonas montiporae TaxID=1027273 RepID=A0A081N4Z8_9GAMM|nr:glucose-specific PTS transporter subunit IIBC [Endozoicomonas montiporae]AMO57610.1 PTS system N-acetylglucosamine-specific transporter subunit IIBC [Endozoicomonas montiporae CL-33]KEQ13521.1 hypothetical protein GZ77_14395 [Endozoicomonas montiporae]
MQNAFSVLQKTGRSLMLPVMILPIAGILLGIGSANFTLIPDLLNGVMIKTGSVIFGNLPLLFAIGTALGLTNNTGTATLTAVVAYLVMLATMGEMAQYLQLDTVTVLGIETINTGILGGILAGILTAVLFNRFHKLKLPDYIGFFEGIRFVPIVSAFAAILLGVVLTYIWMPVESALNSFSQQAIETSPGSMGFLYGFVERLLIPLGIHHIWNIPFQMLMGEFVTATGEVVTGDIARFFAGDPSAGFLAGGFLFKMFGLPGAAIAIWHSARPENKKRVAGLMFSAILAAMMSGITEPIEFAFMYIAPMLYAIHAVLAGIAFMVTNLLDIRMGASFSHGLIDYVLFFSIGNKPFLLIPVGLCFTAIYYFVFRFTIHYFNLKTPGREDQPVSNEKLAVTPELARNLVHALGGNNNLKTIDACITRLRISVNDADVVDQERLKALGARAVVVVGKNLQIIFGPQSESIKTQIVELDEPDCKPLTSPA